MAAILLFFLLLSACHLPVSLSKPTNLTLGSSLFPTRNPTSWLSPSRNGFAVGIWLETDLNKTVVWTANRDNPPVSSNAALHFTRDGWLLLTNPGDSDKRITDANEPALSASLLDSGNFVLYGSNYKIIWQSFMHPTDTILSGQYLPSHTNIYSSLSDIDHGSGRFQLSMQTNGNLVLYPKDSSPTGENSYWCTATEGQGSSVALQLTNNGTFHLVNGTGVTVKTLLVEKKSTSDLIIHRAKLEPDGVLVLYSHNFYRNGSSYMSIRWSAIDDICSIKGYCGNNSYCTHMDTQPDCLCLPGFNFSDPMQRFLGCEGNFNLEDCMGNKDIDTAYSISSVENIAWKETSYSKASLSSKEECSDSCVRDCDCMAATFDAEGCLKFKLPLVYGIRKTIGSRTTFVKVGPSRPENHHEKPNKVVYGEKKGLRMGILVVCIVLATFSFVGFVVSALLFSKYRFQRYKRMIRDRNFSLTEEIALRSFSYSELLNATDGFKEELGRGSFGAVYKGALSSGGRIIAVKRLEKVIEEGEREFRAEMRAIGRTHHRNLVRLLGFCDEGRNRLLVYEYMGNGSLSKLLFKSQQRLDWDNRVRIALDVARGILYLHEDCEPHIIHCDIKPQNILMDDFWTAKISDFGLAKLLMPNQTRTFTCVRGTRGYLAPEWQKNIPISVKTDIYSFGILLLEIVCCRRNLELDGPEEEILLQEWVYRCFLSRELDKILGGEEVEKKMFERLVKVGLWCIQEETHLRPSIKQVITMLEGNIDVPVPPSPLSSA